MNDPAGEWHLLATDETTGDPYEALRKWERLRLLYNAILVPLVAAATLLFGGGLLLDHRYWESVIFGGIASNVCFCLGPILEFYLVRLGASTRTARGWLFALGTTFTALGALAAIVMYGRVDK
ncbi:hypothetical protein [Gemmata sp.]|uniref:hypothetical protein n=1 Tax=Gemmata sp. TaxID=1914242 RepID=UPI003F72BA7A